MPAGSKPMPAAQPATSPTCYTSPIGHVLAAEGRISLQVEKTKREMYGGWLEHTEECEEDGWNIQRNVWRMGPTYRGMYGGWVEGGGQYLTRRFLVCSGPVEGEKGQLLQLTVTVILACNVEPVSSPEVCDN